MTIVPVLRDEDGELFGRLRQVGDDWQPVTVFNAVLAEPTSREDAEALLRQDGLSCLADVWWVERGPGDWCEAHIQEVRPDRLRVRWADPLVDQPASGHWIDPIAVRVQRYRPA